MAAQSALEPSHAVHRHARCADLREGGPSRRGLSGSVSRRWSPIQNSPLRLHGSDSPAVWSQPVPRSTDRSGSTPVQQTLPGVQMNAFQDHYPENVAHCYGCGRLNTKGHQIKTEWDGDETVTRYTPQPYETSVPGFAYGGLIASLIDCHSTGTAAAAMYRQEGRDLDTLPAFRFVTGSL